MNENKKRIGIIVLFCDAAVSGNRKYYNSQEVGLARALQKKNYIVVIFYPKKEIMTPIEEIINENIKVVYAPAKTIGVHSKFDWRIIKQYNIDYARIAGDNQLFAPNCIKYCENNGIKVCSYIGTINSDSKNLIKKSILNLMFVRNLKAYRRHKCFAKNTNVKDVLERRGVVEVEIAPVGLDTTSIQRYDDNYEFRMQIGVPKNKTCVLYVGKMEAYKRPLEALTFLKECRDEIFMLMIGTGPLDEEVDEFIRNNHLENCIIRIKKITNDEIQKYYFLCDFFINFNRDEIFGMCILEAMYQGRTVVAFHAPGPDMIIINNESGFLVNSIDEMKQIVLSGTFLNPITIKTRIENNFTWDVTASKINKWIMEEN